VHKETKMADREKKLKFTLGNTPEQRNNPHYKENPNWSLNDAGVENPSFTARVWFPDPDVYPISANSQVQVDMTKIHYGPGGRAVPVELEGVEVTDKYFVVRVTRTEAGVVEWIDLDWEAT
jgi:hypothetical protein